MGHKIRELISGIDPEKLKGFVEFDESYEGGKLTNKSLSKRAEFYANQPNERVVVGRNTDGKTPVFAMVERQGRVRAFVVPVIRKNAIYKLIKENVDTTAIVSTDESPLYTNLRVELDFDNHGRVNHSKDEYKRGVYCTNTAEGFFSQLKRTIKGTHIHVSRKHLQKYVDEVAFRYMQKDKQATMFETILSHVV